MLSMNDMIIFEKDVVWSVYNPNNFAKKFELKILLKDWIVF